MRTMPSQGSGCTSTALGLSVGASSAANKGNVKEARAARKRDLFIDRQSTLNVSSRPKKTQVILQRIQHSWNHWIADGLVCLYQCQCYKGDKNYVQPILNGPYPLQKAKLHVEAPLHDVTVLHDIFFAFDAELAFLAALRVGTEFGEIMVGNDFTGDEAAFEVAVDDACCLRGFHSFGDGPGAGFLFTCREISLEAE